MSTTITAALRDAGRKLSAADFPGTIRSHFPFWDTQYRPFLLQAIEALPAERFDWKPRPEMMTAHQLILHISEAERWWIHHIVEGGPYEDWVVEHQDPTQGFVTAYEAADHATLLRLLEEGHRRTQHWFDQPTSELSRVIVFQPREGPERRFTLHWILDHLQEHELHHRAQLNLYERMMGIKPPSI